MGKNVTLNRTGLIVPLPLRRGVWKQSIKTYRGVLRGKFNLLYAKDLIHSTADVNRSFSLEHNQPTGHEVRHCEYVEM
jgi:hypothetical protein